MSLNSLIATLDAQLRRLEKLNTSAEPIYSDYFIVDLFGKLLKGKWPQGQSVGATRLIKICTIPSGKFLDPERMTPQGTCFRLPARDAQAAVMDTPLWQKEMPAPRADSVRPTRVYRNAFPVAQQDDPDIWRPSEEELSIAKDEASAMQAEEMSNIPGVSRKRLREVMRQVWGW